MKEQSYFLMGMIRKDTDSLRIFTDPADFNTHAVPPNRFDSCKLQLYSQYQQSMA